MNEKAIVDALEAVGAQVMRLSGAGVPDLAVARQGRIVLLEVKTKTGRLTAAQQHEGFPVVVVRNVDDALRAVGVLGG